MSDVPIHLLTPGECKLWFGAGTLRRAIAEKLKNQYRTGVGVLAFDGSLIAYVQPDGAARELAPPFQHFERWQIANIPPVTECACRRFYDPENGAPWSERKSPDHHPTCEFDRYVFETMKIYNQEIAAGRRRPDALTRIRDELRGRRGPKTGARTG